MSRSISIGCCVSTQQFQQVVNEFSPRISYLSPVLILNVCSAAAIDLINVVADKVYGSDRKPRQLPNLRCGLEIARAAGVCIGLISFDDSLTFARQPWWLAAMEDASTCKFIASKPETFFGACNIRLEHVILE